MKSNYGCIQPNRLQPIGYIQPLNNGEKTKSHRMVAWEETGRPEWTRTIDLCHVKAAL